MSSLSFSVAVAALLISLPATAGTAVWLTQAQYDAARPFPDDVSVHILDAAERLQARLFEPVSRATSPQAARQAALQVFRSPAWPQQEARLKAAFTTVARANALGIEKTPAVVIDDRLVVYGTTNVADARRLAARYPGGAQ
ncbi:TIGR03757 family integrating conjugative element protein [Klebsiella oxytoca]|uniref:TIGR03757 family integrating conjugative element protein n=1 Tax=Klebsiella oxytoca TaxID=571 RepID=UPI00384AB10C